MKNYILKIIIFTLLSFIIIKGIGFFDNIDKRTHNNHNIYKLNEIENTKTLDILFIGNSYCYSGINNMLFDSLGLETYNMSISTAGPIFYSIIYNNAIIVIENAPKRIFVLISPITFSEKSDNFITYPVHRYLFEPIKNEELVINYNLYDKYIELSFNSFTKAVSNIFNFGEKHRESSYKGFVPSDKVTNTESENKKKYIYRSFKKEQITKQRIERFTEFIRSIDNKDNEITIFQLPSERISRFFNNEYISAYDSIINQLSTEYKFINIDTVLDNSFYRNIDHLNSKGANIVTRNLIKHLE